MSTQTSSRRTLLRHAVGVLDALAAPHGIDRYLELVSPTWSSHEVRARIVHAAHTTPSSVTLTLRPNANWMGFRAGQHTQLTVEIDGVRHTRCYSLAGSQHRNDGLVELTVKAHPHGLVSNFLVHNAEPGTVVGLSGAQGDFTLPPQRPNRVMLISGGSGTTPVISMLRTLCDEGFAGPVTFLHYALSASEHLYAAEVAALAATHPNVRPVHVYTDAPEPDGHHGFFTAAQLDAIEPRWAEAETFVCGPAPLMEAVRSHYSAAGLAEQYHDEAFTLQQVIAESSGGTITFTSDGATALDDGRSLLEQAEDAGRRPEYGCRMGICHTCTRSLTCGTVRNLVDGELTNAGTAVRLCVNAPVGDVSIDL